MKTIPFVCILLFCLAGCKPKHEAPVQVDAEKISVVFDTDANNELDDQHALAYLLLNPKAFDVKGITVNATRSGGAIENHYKEAERIRTLCAADSIPLYSGANGSFSEILPSIQSTAFDGKAAVDFLVQAARETRDDKLVVIAVGKLTNIALAVALDSTFVNRVRLVWLGSNFPEPGEYNQDNDTVAMNYLLNTAIPFEMVTVRYGKPDGTDAVKITQDEVNQRMPGLGPKIKNPVTGRHGGQFTCFGDYSVNLFEHIDYYGDPPSRALFDLAAVAIVKAPSWAEQRELPAPILINNQWVERPDNPRRITVWENFSRNAIIDDLFSVLRK
jgi:inosine-uridine nucleoside N-ribohydrolase